MSHEEIATLFHPPTATVAAERMQTSEFTELEPPAKFHSGQEPEAVTIGRVLFRDDDRTIGIDEDARRRHVYVVGSTGAGKSTLLLNLIHQDMLAGRGLTVIDAESNTVTVLLVSGPSNDPSFTLSSDGTFSYTPAANFNGTDSFTYQATDSLGAISNTATMTIFVSSVNDAPVAVADAYDADEDATLSGTSVLTNDSDGHSGAASENNTPLTAQLVTQPSSATSFTLATDGTFTYIPAADFKGTDSFIYQAVDILSGVSNTVTVTITVASLNDGPVGVADSFEVNQDETLVGSSVLDNDSDSHNGAPSESNLPLTAVVGISPANASAFTLNSDGTFTYTPLAGFSGTDSFTYFAVDSLSGVSESVTVSITVVSVN